MPKISRPRCSVLPAALHWQAITPSPRRWHVPRRQGRRSPPRRRSPAKACARWSTASKSGSAARPSSTPTGLPKRSLAGIPEVSVVAFRRGTQCHVFAVRQQLRPDAVTVIAALKARGIGVELLSGDREPAVHHAAQALGVAVWRAGVTPADKIARIEELKRQGHKVMMVGDGMNDAPSLA